MQTKSDAQLLREYSRQGSEAAFGEIVARYTDMVYSTVMRQVGSADLAEEVAQSVFTDLARKAPALLEKLDENGVVAGWLYRSSRFALAKNLRAEQRRRNRESLAMQDIDSTPSTSPDWERVRPVLDEAMADLSDDDRQAMLLRFFQNKGFEAVGAALGISDDAAQKRVGRALEKLRVSLVRQGITTTGALLSIILTTHAVETAPVGLAARLTGASLAGAAAKTGTTLTLMSASSIKTGIIATGIAAALSVWLAVEHNSLNKLQLENAALRQQIGQLKTPVEKLTPVKIDNDEQERLRREHTELLRLRGELGVLRGSMEQQKVDLAKALAEKDKLDTILKMEGSRAKIVNSMLNIRLACESYAKSNNNMFPTSFGQIQDELGEQFLSSKFGTNLFEFIDYGRPVMGATNSRGNVYVEGGEFLILAREKQARQWPDGPWIRTYLFFNGAVQVAESDNGNFDQWEQQATQKPEPTVSQ